MNFDTLVKNTMKTFTSAPTATASSMRDVVNTYYASPRIPEPSIGSNSVPNLYPRTYGNDNRQSPLSFEQKIGKDLEKVLDIIVMQPVRNIEIANKLFKRFFRW